MKKILIHTLLKHYSYLVIAIIVFFASVLSYINWQTYENNLERSQQEVSLALKEELDYYHSRIRHHLYDLSLDEDKVQGIEQYFVLNPAEYQEWLLDHPLFLVKEVSLQKTVQGLYRNLPFVTSITIALTDEEEVFVSSYAFKSGYRLPVKDYKAPSNSLPIIIYDQGQSTNIGTFYITIDPTLLDQVIERQTDLPVQVLIEDSLNRTLYTRQWEAPKGAWETESGDLQIQVGLAPLYSLKEVGRLTLLIFLVSALLIFILLLGLKRVFHHYQVQVTDLVETMQEIATSDKQIRIRTDNKQQEMYLIASQVNDTLDSLEGKIGDIYRLELAQQDANMRALQAQINPHFLYNTLEFFRMYAVTRDMDELADMIVEFSSLLRSSIAQSKMTTLAEELALCEKYSYICQIRYPRSIAYSFQVDKDCEEVPIPRFIVQPLVENYFVHGVDLKRKNNALSIKVLKHGRDVEILIRDNGKGMSAATLASYQAFLAQRELGQMEEKTSIGIRNVHERLLLYFGDRYQIFLTSKENEGVTYSISLQEVLS